MAASESKALTGRSPCSRMISSFELNSCLLARWGSECLGDPSAKIFGQALTYAFLFDSTTTLTSANYLLAGPRHFFVYQLCVLALAD